MSKNSKVNISALGQAFLAIGNLTEISTLLNTACSTSSLLGQAKGVSSAGFKLKEVLTGIQHADLQDLCTFVKQLIRQTFELVDEIQEMLQGKASVSDAERVKARILKLSAQLAVVWSAVNAFIAKSTKEEEEEQDVPKLDPKERKVKQEEVKKDNHHTSAKKVEPRHIKQIGRYRRGADEETNADDSE